MIFHNRRFSVIFQITGVMETENVCSCLIVLWRLSLTLVYADGVVAFEPHIYTLIVLRCLNNVFMYADSAAQLLPTWTTFHNILD